MSLNLPRDTIAWEECCTVSSISQIRTNYISFVVSLLGVYNSSVFNNFMLREDCQRLLFPDGRASVKWCWAACQVGLVGIMNWLV